ncbi:MAG TPA: N-acyl homoserine lactonase family protein, partial [Stellaceae bacterium]|nr:N-acyl homoserine lactonase family protein [Stellaceae bacterium]
FADRVVFHDGDEELAPGLSVHRVGGHTRGLQVVRVRTGRGHVVLASDAAHFYANWHERRPFPIVDSVADYLDALKRVECLADSPDHVIPGHDPLVLQLYPAVGEGIARLDLPPR